MDEDLKEVKKLITSVLVSSPTAMTLVKLDKDYLGLIGERIPFKTFGYPNLEQFLLSMPDILQIRGQGLHAEIIVRINSNVAHLDKLISKQRMPTLKHKSRNIRRRSTINEQSYARRSDIQVNSKVPIVNTKIPVSIPHHTDYGNVTYTNGLPKKNFECINQNEPISKTASLSSNEKVQVTNTSVSKPQQQSFSKSPFVNSTRQIINAVPAGYTSSFEKPSTCSSKDKPSSKKCKTPPPSKNISNEHANLSLTNSVSKSSTSVTQGAVPKKLQSESEMNDNYQLDNFQLEIAHNHLPENTLFTDISLQNSDNVPINVQIRLDTLINRFEEGIWCAKLPEIYKNMFDKELDYTEYGYRSLISMCLDLKEIFIGIRPGRADFKLFSRKKPLPDEYYMKFPNKTTFKNSIEELSTQSSNEPALMNLEELKYIKDVAVYPPNVVHPSVKLHRQFLSPDVQENDFIRVMVGEIYDPSKFWILLSEQYTELCGLMSDLQSYYTCNDVKLLIPRHMIVPDLYCVAKYNNEYSRAIVIENLKTLIEYYHVFYIDYGTVAAVHFLEIYYLNEQFAILPCQAIRARLANIYPVNQNTQWSTEAASRFLNLVYEKNLYAQIARIDNKDEIVDVFLADTSSGKDIYVNDTLVYEGYAVFTNQEQQPVETDIKYIPHVKYIHLFPTFFEIENAIVISGNRMSILEEIGISLDEVYPQYFIKLDELNSSQNEDKEMAKCPSSLKENCSNEYHTPNPPLNDTSLFFKDITSLPILPTTSVPPGFERIHALRSNVNAALQNYPPQMMNPPYMMNPLHMMNQPHMMNPLHMMNPRMMNNPHMMNQPQMLNPPHMMNPPNMMYSPQMNPRGYMQYNLPQYPHFNASTWNINQLISNYPFYQFNYCQYYQQQPPWMYQDYKEPITQKEELISLQTKPLSIEEKPHEEETKIVEIEEEIPIIYDEEQLQQAINKIIDQLLLGNKEMFIHLVEQLKNCDPKIEDFCHTLVTVLIIHKFPLYKQVMDRLSDKQIIELEQKEIELSIHREQRLSNTINESYKTNTTNELCESFENLVCSSEINYSADTDDYNDVNLTQNIEQHNINEPLVYPIDLFDRRIHVIRVEDEIYAIVSEIVEFTEHAEPIEKIRKLIVMIDPPYTITDLSLKDNQELYEELCRYQHYKKDSILHIIPVKYVPEMIDNLGCIYLDPNYDEFFNTINNLHDIKQY